MSATVIIAGNSLVFSSCGGKAGCGRHVCTWRGQTLTVLGMTQITGPLVNPADALGRSPLCMDLCWALGIPGEKARGEKSHCNPV